MAARGEVALHQMFAPIAHVRGDKAYVEAAASMRIAVEVDDVPGDLVVHSRLNFRLARRAGQWRILSLDAIYEHSTLTPAVPGQTITIPPQELAPFRASYAILAWNISRRGIAASADELGDDQPARIKAFYDEIWDWLVAP